jgi:hypothetical protein
MGEVPAKLLPFVPWMLIVYALTFVAGGMYYLEQRVTRVRDQFPRRALFARLTGYAALAIGLLTAVSIGGHLIHPEGDHHLGALVAVSAGVAFWIHRLSAEITVAHRIRDALLALVCVSVAGLTVWWIDAL